jgi:hypothetical protein
MDSQGRVVYGLIEEPGQNVNLAYVERMLATGERDTSFDRGYIECPVSQRFTNNETSSWVTDVEVDSLGNVFALVDCFVPLVVKLRHTDGYYDTSFGVGGFLDINAGRSEGGFWANSLTLDAQGNIYVLGDDFPTNSSVGTNSTVSTKQIRKFNPSGNASNFVSSNQNFVNFPAGENIWLITTQDDVSGLMEYDYSTNSLIFGGVSLEDLTVPSSLWLSRFNLNTSSFRWDASSIFWESGLPSDETWSLVALDLTVDPNGWISVGGYQTPNDYNVQTPFVVQVRPIQSGATYSITQNGPIWLDTDEGSSPCWVYSVMADDENRLYSAGSCANTSFIKRYRSDGTLDSTFTGLETNIAGGLQGSYQPRYLLDTGDELAVFGIGSNNSWPAFAFVSKYRTSSFDDSPPPPPVVVPAPVVAPVPAPVVAPAPAAVAAAPVAPAQPTMAIKQKTAGTTLAKQIGMTVAPKAKVKLSVAKASKKICKVSGGKLVALKPGNCSVTVSVTPKKTKLLKKPKTSKRSTVVRIS